MVTRFYAIVPRLTIPDGTDVSNILNCNEHFQDAVALSLFGTKAAYGTTYTVQVNRNPDATNASTDWCDLDIDGTDLVPPAAGKAIVSEQLVSVGAIRIKAAANVGEDEFWDVGKHYLS